MGRGRRQHWNAWRRASESCEAGPRFAAALDVAKGGVLLPPLVSGLLRHVGDYFRLSATADYWVNAMDGK